MYANRSATLLGTRSFLFWALESTPETSCLNETTWFFLEHVQKQLNAKVVIKRNTCKATHTAWNVEIYTDPSQLESF